ncbi:hypothetical protein [Thiomonas sp.]
MWILMSLLDMMDERGGIPLADEASQVAVAVQSMATRLDKLLVAFERVNGTNAFQEQSFQLRPTAPTVLQMPEGAGGFLLYPTLGQDLTAVTIEVGGIAHSYPTGSTAIIFVPVPPPLRTATLQSTVNMPVTIQTVSAAYAAVLSPYVRNNPTELVNVVNPADAPAQVSFTNSNFQVRITDSGGSGLNALGSAVGYSADSVGRSLMTTSPILVASAAAGSNVAAIAATSWGNVLTVDFAAGSGTRAVLRAGATLGAAIAAQTGAWRITQAGTTVREFLVLAGTTVEATIDLGMIATSSAVTMNLDWYNTASTALAIGAVQAWWAYL